MPITTGQAIAIGATALQGANIASSWMDGGHSARKTFRKNLDYQYQKQKEAVEDITKPYYAWQLRNNPRLTVEGLKAAGINPLTVYGQNAGMSGSTDSVTPDVDADYSGIANSEVHAAMMRTQGISSIADNLKTLAETNKIKADTDNVKADTQTKITYNEFQRQLLAGEVKTQEGNIINLELEGDVKRETVLKIRAEVDNLDASTNNLNAQTKNLNETYNLLLQQGKINEAELYRIASETALNTARAVRERFGVKLDAAQIEHLSYANMLMASQNNALYAANVLAEFLNNNAGAKEYYQFHVFNNAIESNRSAGINNEKTSRESDYQFILNENGKLSLQVRNGQSLQRVEQARQEGFKNNGPLGAGWAIGTTILDILTQETGNMLNGIGSAAVKR